MKLLKPAVFFACLLPLGWVVYRLIFGFVPNPVAFVIAQMGIWALRFLLLTLALTPLRLLTGWDKLARLRRMLGLYAFFYACLHMLTFWGADLNFSVAALGHEMQKRRFITFGLMAFVLLIPLAVTSTNQMVKRLGGKRWRRLHKLAYVVAVLGVLHLYWLKMAKANFQQPLLYMGILAVIIALRLLLPRMRRR